MWTSAEASTMPLYLSRLHLNPRDRNVQRDLANSQALHRRLLDAFPDARSRAEVGMLYRVEAGHGSTASDATVLVQSTAEPDWTQLGSGYLRDNMGPVGWPEDGPAQVKAIGDVYARIAPADRFRFRLRANPTRKRHFTPEASSRPTGPNGTRVPIYGDAELLDWIARKGEQQGFGMIGAQSRPDPVTGAVQRGTKTDGRRLVHYAVLFDGVLEVTDATSFREALVSGVGPAKSYGFGLLSLASIST